MKLFHATTKRNLLSSGFSAVTSRTVAFLFPSHPWWYLREPNVVFHAKRAKTFGICSLCGLCVFSPLRSLREPWLRTVSRKARKDIFRLVLSYRFSYSRISRTRPSRVQYHSSTIVARTPTRPSGVACFRKGIGAMYGRPRGSTLPSMPIHRRQLPFIPPAQNAQQGYKAHRACGVERFRQLKPGKQEVHDTACK